MSEIMRARSGGATPVKRWAVTLILACLAGFPCAASVVNGSFDDGLLGWTAEGDVSATTEAALADGTADYSLLYQGVALGAGTYCLEFDFQGLFFSTQPTNGAAFPDTFFASLYFVDDISTFDLAGGGFDATQPLMSLDPTGPFDVAGTLGASLLGPDWTHFQINFTNNYAWVIPVFELFDPDSFPADSEVRIDNVTIGEPCSVVPEPATLSLCALGLTVYGAARRRRG